MERFAWPSLVLRSNTRHIIFLETSLIQDENISDVRSSFHAWDQEHRQGARRAIFWSRPRQVLANSYGVYTLYMAVQA